MVGRVAAGEPILAQENVEGYLDLKSVFSPTDGSFCLRVMGDSMVDEGIMDGDYVVVRRQAEVSHGELAVVLLDDEATVKRVLIQKDRLGLKPANRAGGYCTKYVKRDDKAVRIVGKVVGCFRRIER